MQLFCLDCGLEVFSQATCCCTQRVRDNLSAYRVHSPAVNLPQGEFYCIRWAALAPYLGVLPYRATPTSLPSAFHLCQVACSAPA
jgi:hypothetical protein